MDETSVTLRIIHPNGTVSEINKDLGFKNLNDALLKVLVLLMYYLDPISIFALQKVLLLVRYFNAINTYEECGRIIDWNGNLYNTQQEQHVDPEKEFIRIIGTNVTYVEGDTFNLKKLSEGNITLLKSGTSALFNIIATIDEGYICSSTNSDRQVCTLNVTLNNVTLPKLPELHSNFTKDDHFLATNTPNTQEIWIMIWAISQSLNNVTRQFVNGNNNESKETIAVDFSFDLITELSKILSIDSKRLTLREKPSNMIEYKSMSSISLFHTTKYLEEDFGFKQKRADIEELSILYSNMAGFEFSMLHFQIKEKVESFGVLGTRTQKPEEFEEFGGPQPPHNRDIFGGLQPLQISATERNLI
ncbi:4461_t:CDS:10 [Diversispora eburnea]|uniref:4461_t:CDS:1 n=1 Tax=Diversispora eburnea TaxID=1213867 RepID=A0A9N9BPH7_9GLOM|nr:4461_t:CDS:10 [Diversispora eburnea]